MTPEDIAKQRHHHDIVELLTDWSLGCNSPKTVTAPTSPPEVQKSPLASMPSSPATSPSAVEIHNGGAPSLVTHFQPARPKATVNRAPGTQPRSTASRSNNNNDAKRKRKKAHPDEEVYPTMSTVTTLSPPNLATSCATGQPQPFSPNCVQITNELSRLGSTDISPVESTTLSLLQAPCSLDTQPPSPLEPLEPLQILWPDNLVGLEEVQIGWDDLALNDIDFNDKASNTMPLQLTSYQAITNSNMFPGCGGGGENLMPPRKDYQNDNYSIYHQQLPLHNHQLVYAGGEMLPSQPQKAE